MSIDIETDAPIKAYDIVCRRVPVSAWPAGGSSDTFHVQSTLDGGWLWLVSTDTTRVHAPFTARAEHYGIAGDSGPTDVGQRITGDPT